MKHNKTLLASMLITGGLLVSAEAYCALAVCYSDMSSCINMPGCVVPIKHNITFSGFGTPPDTASVQINNTFSSGVCSQNYSANIYFNTWQQINGYFYGIKSGTITTKVFAAKKTVTCGPYAPPAGGPYKAVCLSAILSETSLVCGTPIWSTSGSCS